jgi:hypothetical protein
MSQNNVFDYMWLERQKSRLKGYRDNVNHFYTTETEHLKHRNNFEIEQYRAGASSDLERQKQNGRIEIEEKRGIIAQWIEKFRREGNNELESHRQSGALTLQEREHIQQKTLLEISEAERKLELDTQHARTLELANQADEFLKFRQQREQKYAIDLKRVDSILQEYTQRNELGANLAGFTSTVLTGNAQSSARMNEAILSKFLELKMSKHQAKQTEATNKTVKNAIEDQVDKWENG